MTSRMAVLIAIFWVVGVVADIRLVRVVDAVGVVIKCVRTRCAAQVARVQRICHPQRTVLLLVEAERVVSQLRVRWQRCVCCNLVVRYRACCRQLCPTSSQCRLLRGFECRKLYCLSKERLALGCVIPCAVYYDVGTSVVCCVLVESRNRFFKTAACSAWGRCDSLLTRNQPPKEWLSLPNIGPTGLPLPFQYCKLPKCRIVPMALHHSVHSPHHFTRLCRLPRSFGNDRCL